MGQAFLDNVPAQYTDGTPATGGEMRRRAIERARTEQAQPMASEPMPINEPQAQVMPDTLGASLMPDTLGVNQQPQPNFGGGMMGDVGNQAYGMGAISQPQQIGYNQGGQAPMMQPQMMQQPMTEEEQRRMQYTGY
jgi:hypothetical protein